MEDTRPSPVPRLCEFLGALHTVIDLLWPKFILVLPMGAILRPKDSKLVHEQGDLVRQLFLKEKFALAGGQRKYKERQQLLIPLQG